MGERVRRLLNLRPGEEQKTALLYGLHFVFYVGLMWGEAASLGLFMGTWGADYLSYIFIGNGLLALVLGLVYTSFADKVSNARLLVALSSLVGGAVLIVWVWMGVDSASRSLVYPVFLLIFRAFRPLFTLHVLNYINDFYDTRAAKRVLSLIVSASVAGAMLAGLVISPMISLFGLENIVLGWAVCLLLVILLVGVCERRLGEARQAQLAPSVLAGMPELEPEPSSNLENLRDGFRFVKSSSFLRLLALATLAMAFINNLFDFQATWAVAQRFPTAREQTIFYGVLGGVSNLISLIIQLFLLSRVVAWLGVGLSNLIFPVTSLFSYTVLGLAPNLTTAIGGRLNASVIKGSFRNPIDAMLYNTVPVQVKGRARAFVNGILVPVGVFGVGLLLFLVPSQSSLPARLAGLGVGVAGLYLILSWRLRGKYSQALVDMLEEEDFSLYRLATAELSTPDAFAFRQLVAKFEASRDDNMRIFVAQVISQVGGQRAALVLSHFYQSSSERVREAILSILSEAELVGEPACQLYLQGLADESGAVRRAALVGWQKMSSPDDESFLSRALELLDDDDLGVRAQVIPPLIQSGDFFYLAAAVQSLSGLLDSPQSEPRLVGVQILGAMDDPRFIRSLADYMQDPDDRVRRKAAMGVERLAAQPMPEWVEALALEVMGPTVTDPVERVRLAGVATLRRIGGPAAVDGLMTALRDTSRLVRQRAAQALQALGSQAAPDLQEALAEGQEDELFQETLVAILARIDPERFALLVDRHVERNLQAGYQALANLETLGGLPATPGLSLLQESLREQVEQRLERFFDLVTAGWPEETVQVVVSHLHSPSRRVQANAIEALESLTSPRIGRLIAPLVSLSVVQRQSGRAGGGVTLADALELGQREWGVEPPTPRQMIKRSSHSPDPWLRACTIYALGEGRADLLRRAEIDEILETYQDDASPDVCHAVRLTQLRLEQGHGRVKCGEEGAMLSAIERVIFLKEVPFFESMTIEQLRILASVSEECTFDEDKTIFAEGDSGDALYVIVSGRVAIERQGRRQGSVVRLATLESRQYFGEMTIFDGEPRSASATAIEPALLLRLGRAPLQALSRENPDLSIELLRVLSRRLRETNALIAEKSKARPRELERLYDKLG